MASAPRGQHELDFEAEEAAILTAVGQTRIDLMVEDTGDPEHLGRRLAGLGGMPVVHLSWKSTLIRRCSTQGRPTAAKSRSPVMSAPSSNFWSNSSALIQRDLLLTGSASRDDPDRSLSVGHYHRPVLALHLADHQPPCRHFTGLPDGR
jgi:hypothetical protein